MELPSSPEFIISCEHAGNQVPEEYQSLFEGAAEILSSHRGWDPGALELAEKIAEKTGSELFSYPYTRLFIEPNRSIGHPILFSEFSRTLTKIEKQEIIKKFYQPYREKIIETIRKIAVHDIPVIHISVHTFTPVFKEKERDFEIGLLYDPKKNHEKNVCQLWRSILKQTVPDYRIRMNRPYKGASDGFTTYLRKIFHKNETFYIGIELEINQKLLFNNNGTWNHLCTKVGESLSVLSNRLRNH